MNEQMVLDQVVVKCTAMVESLGFQLPPITYKLVGGRVTSLGMCRKTCGKYSIEMSTTYMQEFIKRNDYHAIEDVMLHEMCHALPNGMNHGDQWKFYANRVNHKFGYNICRVAERTEATMAVRVDNSKYVIRCETCGNTSYYLRKPKVANRLQNCRCGKCKSSALILEVK